MMLLMTHALDLVTAPKKVIDMALIFLSKSVPGQSALESANSANRTVFLMYVVFLILAFAGTLYFTWKLYDSGDRVQQAIQEDAQARIASAQQDASVKIEKVKADAQLNVESARNEAKKEISAAKSEAELKIAATNERAAKVEDEAAKLKAANLATEGRLESERAARLEMEQSLRRRELIIHVNTTNNTSDIDQLKQYAGTEVMLEYLPDSEVARAAKAITGVIQACGWKVIKEERSEKLNEEFYDGVVIWRPLPSGAMDNSDTYAVSIKSFNAAEELMKFLVNNGWLGVHAVPAKPVIDAKDDDDRHIRPNVIKIFVGFKPTPYFRAPELKEMDRRFEAMQKQFQEQNDKYLKERSSRHR